MVARLEYWFRSLLPSKSYDGLDSKKILKFWALKKLSGSMPVYQFCILKVYRSKFLNFWIFLSLKIGFIVACSTDPD